MDLSVKGIIPFSILEDSVKKTQKFGLCRRNVVFKINDVPSKEDPEKWVQKGVENIIYHIMSDVDPEDRVGLAFSSENFAYPAYMSFKKANHIRFEDIWNLLQSIFQSKSEGLDTSKFRVIMTACQMPKGRGRKRRGYYNDFEEECTMRRGIVTINNKDNLCLPRALVVGKAFVKKNPQYKKIRDSNPLQKQKADKLMRKTGVVIVGNGAGIAELYKFQEHLRKYQITVYTYGAGGRDLLFEGPHATKKINLLFHNNHFNVITSLTSAFGYRHYCEKCHIPFNNSHRCEGSCRACQQTPPCEWKQNTFCASCNREFKSQNCFENHVKSGLCDKIKRCPDCHRTVKKDRDHNCYEVFCKICKLHQPENHLCHMQVNTLSPRVEDILFIFFDFETRQETPLKQNSEATLHEPNLCVMYQRCDVCINEDSLYFCQKCGFRQKHFKCNPVQSFMGHVTDIRKKFKQVVVLAHNSQAFDGQFILKYLLENNSQKPELIMQGSKIILMKIDNVKFIDSLNYFPMALSALPKAFGFESIVNKGYFPHLFNTKANENYVGPLPCVDYYSPDTMRPEERQTFLKWYEAHETDTFDMRKDLLAYCSDDVEVLARACLKFRQIMLEECNVCPFTEATTIASSCGLVFRRNFLKTSTIGIIPRGGYRKADIQSKIALKWLIEEGENRGIEIIHAGNNKEVIFAGAKVDGYCSETSQIFEFHGCYYHGCPTCFTVNREQSLHDDPSDTLEARYRRALEKTCRLKNQGYEVTEMWECQYTPKISDNHPILRFVPLNPRDSLYGGRTGNSYQYYNIKMNEKIKYLDVCSLYPWVCKYGKFPVGHPKVYVGVEAENLIKGSALENVDGLIKCMVLPPNDLLHPVLPVKMNNKLMFPLCYACANTFNQKACIHSEADRALTGTWVIDEVIKAVELGYKIMNVYEIWKYQVIQLDNEIEGIFTDFINKFLKMKQQANGWPSNCTTLHEKNHYIDNYMTREGVQLEVEKIAKNPGLRSLSKLILNSFWGKLAQTENQPKTNIIEQPKDLYYLLSDPAVEVNSVQEVNESVIVVNWQHKEEATVSSPFVNVAVAAYVTTQARLKLYTYLEQLQDRVLYYDTDSVIFISTTDSKHEPMTGNFLGELTDELEEYGKGSYITEFVSTGPKSYGYRGYSPQTGKTFEKCKVKGFTLNYNGSMVINLESMREMILNKTEEENKRILTISRNIRRTKEYDVISKTETKIFKVTGEKRKFLEDHTSLPYGHKSLQRLN